MMKTEIVDKNASVLRQIAKEVPLSSITSKKIEEIIRNMKEPLEGQEDGVAIAAPQINKSLRIFVVSHRAFTISKEDEATPTPSGDLVFINPEIIKVSKKKNKVEEGCLSVRWLYGKVERCEKVNIRAWNEKGEVFERGSSGLLAQIFQHEIDHLNGILFIDKAAEIENIPPKPDNE